MWYFAAFWRNKRWYCIPSKTSRSSLMRSYFLVQLALIIVSLHPDKSSLDMSLRPRGHSFDVPRYRYDLTRKSFIFRSLYITDNISEHVTCVYVFVMTSLCYFCMYLYWETVDVKKVKERIVLREIHLRTVFWLLFVILTLRMYVTLRLSKFSIKHYLLTYTRELHCYHETAYLRWLGVYQEVVIRMPQHIVLHAVYQSQFLTPDNTRSLRP